MTTPRARSALLVAVLLSCATSGTGDILDKQSPPTDLEARAAWLRGRMAAAPDDLLRSFLRDDLARVEFERARQSHTVFAYRRFLAEFPAGETATSASALLESLRFDEAARADTVDAWNEFVAEHPRGRRVADARLRLGALEFKLALAGTDLAHVRRILARHPDHPERAVLVAHEDALSFKEVEDAARAALASNAPVPATALDGLDRYVVEHPTGRFRADALSLRDEVEARRLLESEDLAAAHRRASAGDATPALRAVESRLELTLALRQLDTVALARLAALPLPAVADPARIRLESLQRLPLSPEVLDALEYARHGGTLRSRDTLREEIGRADPLERVAALQELLEWSRPEDVGFITSLVDGRWLGLSLAAIEGLRGLARTLPPAVVRARLADEETRLLSNPLDAGAWRRIAALREALDRPADAISAWREVLRDEPDEVLGRARLLALELSNGDRLSANAAARDLATAAAAFGDARELAPPSRDLPPEARRDGPGEVVGTRADVSVLRQLCTALQLVGNARDALVRSRVSAGPAEGELVGLAIADADRALDRLGRRRREMEQEARKHDPSFVACDAAPTTPSRLEEIHRDRVAGLNRLAAACDARVREAVEELTWSFAEPVRVAAKSAWDTLGRCPPEPPAPPAPPPPTAKPAPKRTRRR